MFFGLYSRHLPTSYPEGIRVRRCTVEKEASDFDNLVTQLDLGHPGEHGLGRAVGGFGKFHRPFHGSRVNMAAGDEIFDLYLGKDAWMLLRSLGMDAYLEGGYILAQMWREKYYDCCPIEYT
jgi:hypothetical protein